MITFEKKADLPLPVAGETEENRFDRIRRLPRKGIRNRTPMARAAATDRRPRTTAYVDIAVTPGVAMFHRRANRYIGDVGHSILMSG